MFDHSLSFLLLLVEDLSHFLVHYSLKIIEIVSPVTTINIKKVSSIVPRELLNAEVYKLS